MVTLSCCFTVQERGGAGEDAAVVDVLLLPEPLLPHIHLVPGGAEARLAQDPPRQGLQVGHASPVRRPPFNLW